MGVSNAIKHGEQSVLKLWYEKPSSVSQDKKGKRSTFESIFSLVEPQVLTKVHIETIIQSSKIRE